MMIENLLDNLDNQCKFDNFFGNDQDITDSSPGLRKKSVSTLFSQQQDPFKKI